MIDEITLEECFEAYYECRKNKRRTFNALNFEADYEANVVALYYEIVNRTYRPGRSIAFIVTKPKKREVFAADFRDRVVHHILIRKLEKYFESVFITDNYNCRKGKGTLYGVKRLYEKVQHCTKDGQNCYIMKCDIQGFFMSIHKPTLWAMVEQFINERYDGTAKDTVLFLAKTIILHCPARNCIRRSPIHAWKGLAKNKSLFTVGDDYGLPIGNLTSQIFANFYLHAFDMLMQKMFGEQNGRYVDDFYAISHIKEALYAALPTIRKVLRDDFKLTLHPKKVYVQHYTKGVKFTGGVIKGKRMYVGSQTVANWVNTIREMNHLAETEPGYIYLNAEKFCQRMNSYFGFMSHYSSYNIRVKLMKTVLPIWWKVCYIDKDFKKIKVEKEFKTSVKLIVLAKRKKVFNNNSKAA